MRVGISASSGWEGDRMTALAGWENFYVIVGSSAGALIGLQFVVVALIAGCFCRNCRRLRFLTSR